MAGAKPDDSCDSGPKHAIVRTGCGWKGHAVAYVNLLALLALVDHKSPESGRWFNFCILPNISF
jgi:hypothetical protein